VPDKIASVVLIDGIIPAPIPADEAPQQLGRYLKAHASVGLKSSPEYDSIDAAVTARLVSTIMPMEKQAIERIVKRGLKEQGGHYVWSSDPRLRLPSSIKLNEDQCRAYAKSLVVPNLLLLASGGLGKRLELKEFIEAYSHIHSEEIDGGHHLHMEGQAAVLAEKITAFYNRVDS